MEKQSSSRSAPLLVPAILALAVLGLLGYLLFSGLQQSSRTEHTVGPPIVLEDEDNPSHLEIVEIDPPPLNTDESHASADTTASTTSEEKAAETFVDNLAPADDSNQPVTLTTTQDQFVRHDGTVVLSDQQQRDTTVAELQQDTTLTADTAITLTYTGKTTQTTTLNDLASQSNDQNQQVTVTTADGTEISASINDLLQQDTLDPNSPISVTTQQQYTTQTTVAELDTLGIAADQAVSATILQPQQTLNIKDIIQSDEIADSALFYLHRVTDKDIQGLWGIIQTGLIERFREGLAIENEEATPQTVKIIIPHDADEPLPDGLSSFLGKVLDQKVTNSYIYNLSSNTMGHDPNIIHPGQQLILIHFSQDELKRIYQFFHDEQASTSQSFAIRP